MTEKILRWIAAIIFVVSAAIAVVQLNSKTWPHVRGVVQYGNWQSARTIYSQEKGYEVRYEYKVSGRTYIGNNMGWAAKSNTVLVLNGKDGQPEELTPRDGNEVNVFYAPWWPAFSVLVPGPSVRLWIWMAVSVLICIMLVGAGRVSSHPLF